MDKNFRDMCAIMAMQAIIAGKSGEARNAGATAAQAFDVAAAMMVERERRERDARADRYGYRAG